MDEKNENNRPQLALGSRTPSNCQDRFVGIRYTAFYRAKLLLFEAREDPKTAQYGTGCCHPRYANHGVIPLGYPIGKLLVLLEQLCLIQR